VVPTLLIALAVLLACHGVGQQDEAVADGGEAADGSEATDRGEAAAGADEYAAVRDRMVRHTIEARGVRDSLVLAAMRAVPRHLFVPASARSRAYADHPLPIGAGQTISQPYIVALMTELLDIGPGDRVLEIGTGSGYQAAVLAEITDAVYSIEIIRILGRRAEAVLHRLGYDHVQVRIGDGYRGWPEQAPFDAVIVTAAPDHVPEPLVEQLAPGGRLVIPVGDRYQELLRITRREDGGVDQERIIPVRFVPMTGEAQER
jgi:protein-L-isoaspartate(D-aspartate) O-methyltransferase